MSVLVKGMDMPKTCADCKLILYGDGTYVCPFSWVPALNIGRQDSCPLVEVKTPHGDLIDVSKISSTVGYYTLANGKTLEKHFYEIDYIQNAPAVIEAEE